MNQPNQIKKKSLWPEETVDRYRMTGQQWFRENSTPCSAYLTSSASPFFLCSWIKPLKIEFFFVWEGNGSLGFGEGCLRNVGGFILSVFSLVSNACYEKGVAFECIHVFYAEEIVLIVWCGWGVGLSFKFCGSDCGIQCFLRCLTDVEDLDRLCVDPAGSTVKGPAHLPTFIAHSVCAQV